MIGNQELYLDQDKAVYTINEVLPQKGYKFAFGIRDRVFQECLKRGKKLEIKFKEHPNITFTENPIKWQMLGKEKKEVKNFKNRPMTLFYYFVDFQGQLTKKESDEHQTVLF